MASAGPACTYLIRRRCYDPNQALVPHAQLVKDNHLSYPVEHHGLGNDKGREMKGDREELALVWTVGSVLQMCEFRLIQWTGDYDS
jgi:hypothetical protein